MSTMTAASNISAPTQFLQVKNDVEPASAIKDIHQPTLVVNGLHDEMMPVSNSYRLAENLPNAVLLAYPTPDTAPSSNFTTRLPATLPHFSRRTHRSHPTESPRGNRERIEVDYTHETAALQQVADRIAANSLNGRASGH